jgi:hypothetical protein
MGNPAGGISPAGDPESLKRAKPFTEKKDCVRKLFLLNYG